jgi:sulfite reductase alpha subunit-like flavoprotein
LKFCYDEDQYESLQNIIKKDTKYNEYLKKNYNIVDFLNFYDSINLPFLEFYRLMPKITPRFYTVASSSNYNKNKMEIIISLLNWKGANGELRYGLTSKYYKDIFDNFKLGGNNGNKNFYTKIIIRESSFKLPKSLDAPMIMIATGTGIAPYISFCQEFDHISNHKEIQNNTVLIFGSKNKQYDFIYEEEINSYMNKSIIKKLFTAFSRDNQQKYYVQDVILESKSELEHLLLHKESIIYICGGVSMGAEVTATLEKILCKEVVKRLESENRLIKELWG